MKFQVQMLAFGEPGEIREVDVPSDERLSSLRVEVQLDMVFRYGQNEFQPQQHPSVSAGDVVEIGHERWLIEGVGFRKMTWPEYFAYLGLSRRDRFLFRD